ncbi:hypothetical protein DMX02_04375 [Pseudomonas jessenii]|nr:hypothetical protein DMX02_04375 [Pseudomonas jessenii]
MSRLTNLDTEMASVGISADLRDTARFAELVRREPNRGPSADSLNQAVRSTFQSGDSTIVARGNLARGRRCWLN